MQDNYSGLLTARDVHDKSALYGSSLEFFLLWSWQPAAAMTTTEKTVRAAAGGEESRKEPTGRAG